MSILKVLGRTNYILLEVLVYIPFLHKHILMVWYLEFGIQSHISGIVYSEYFKFVGKTEVDLLS